LVPALFILGSARVLYATFTGNLRYSVGCTVLILAGIPVFYGFAFYRRRYPDAR